MEQWDAQAWLDRFNEVGARYRALRTEVWQNTLDIVQQGGYIRPDGTFVRVGKGWEMTRYSRMYHEPIQAKRENPGYETCITVSPSDCLDVAHEWVKDGRRVSVLNMANRQNPGGGVLSGAGAQEEYLFRCTNYYRSMFRYVDYAGQFGLTRSHWSYPLDRNNGGIYTPGVTVFRANEERGYALLDEPWRVNMIAVPGMNNPRLVDEGGQMRIAPELVEGVKNKIRTIFRIALDQHETNLVLGALGCGAFHNPPRHVAELFKEVLCETEFVGAFERICFAVKKDHNSRGDSNYIAFRDILDHFVPKYEERGDALIYSGKMRDGHTFFEVYANHNVKVTGSGSLVFNLRDFPLENDQTIRYKVEVIGDFHEVGYSAFFDWLTLESVVLPMTIRKIGERCFSDCDNLKCITMPGNITQIGDGSFAYSAVDKVILYDAIPVNDSLVQFFKRRGTKVMWRGKEL